MSDYEQIDPIVEKMADELAIRLTNELTRMIGPRFEYVPLAGWNCPQCSLKTDAEGYCACGRNMGTRTLTVQGGGE